MVNMITRPARFAPPLPATRLAKLQRTSSSSVGSSTQKVGGRTKLRPQHAQSFLEHHPPGLFRDTALVVCDLGILPRKELYECWEVATRVHARFPTSRCVADLAAGHGLLAWMLLLLARGGRTERRVVSVDHKMPPSAETLAAAFCARWPDMDGCHDYVEGDLARVEPDEHSLLTAVHACGPLTDSVLALTIRSGCAAAVMPCCHSVRKFEPPLGLGLDMDDVRAEAKAVGPSAAIDSCRLRLLHAHGYAVDTQHVDKAITPHNRLILATPPPSTEGRLHSSAPPLPAAPVQAAFLWHERNGSPLPPPIPIHDAEAVKAMAGRQTIETRRSIEVSCWVAERTAIDANVLTRLATRAASLPDEGPWEASSEAATAFAVDAESTAPPDNVRDADAAGGGVVKGASADVVVGSDEAAVAAAGGASCPTVSTEVCDEYTDPESGRSARSFRILFASSESWRRQISKKDTIIWQRRVRRALEAHAADDIATGFELR